MTFTSVHPRVCGEQISADDIDDAMIGSSPRVRGTDLVNDVSFDDERFIPACAGNSSITLFRLVLVPVHPRVCGEQSVSRIFFDVQVGSSPRVRGTEAHMKAMEKWYRFIPACAGNSAGGSPEFRVHAVHPRVCGEQGSRPNVLASVVGSSPRVRGTVVRMSRCDHLSRFIPACAGNSDLRRG